MKVLHVKSWASVGAAVIANLLAVTQAHAHFQAPGLSDFNAGVLHPLLTMQHALALAAFGLMCGQGGAAMLRSGLPGLAFGLVLGFMAAEMAVPADDAPRVLTVLALLAGLTVAGNIRLPAWVCITLGLVIGTAIGIDSKPEIAILSDELAGISGTSIAVLLLFLNAAGLAAFAVADWQRIGIRVIGSWTSAAAFLNIALLFRK